MNRFTFTSESVTEGHPDKVCDAISDALVDDLLRQDPESHVACETLATKQLVVVSGEVRSKGTADVEAIVKNTLRDIGYTNEARGMDDKAVEILVKMQEQSSEISQGVDESGSHEQGAGESPMAGHSHQNDSELRLAPLS